MDQRVHRDHMVERSKRPVGHITDLELDAAMAEPTGRALARMIDQCRRQVDRDHVGAAQGGLDREGAGSATGVEDAAAAQIVGKPAEQKRPHLVTTGPDRGADPADRRIGGKTRPGIGGGSVEISLDLAAALLGRSKHSLVVPQQVEDISVLHRLGV